MISGVSVGSFMGGVTLAAISGTWSANFPLANLADLVKPSNVARVTPASGAAAFSAVLTGPQAVQVLALVNHTLPAGATVRARFYSDAALTTLVYDTTATAIAIPAPVAGYAQSFPVVLAAPLTVRGVRVDLAGLSGDAELGGLEIAGWWGWPPILLGAQAGVSPLGNDLGLVGGGSAGAESVTPRIYNGELSAMALAVSSTTALDFAKLKGTARPFVFVEDYSDPTTWPRSCFLARNVDLLPLVAKVYGFDTQQFRLVEHVR